MRLNIRAKLTLALSAVAIVSVAIHSLISTRTLTTKLQDEIITRLSHDNLQKMETLDRFLFERLSDISILTSQKNIALSSSQLDIRGKIEYLRDLERQRKVYISMSIYNSRGIRIGDTRGLGLGTDDSSELFFKEALKGMIYSHSRPIDSARLGGPVMQFSGPLHDENGVITGVVVTRFPINKINQIIKGGNQGQEKTGIQIDLLDRDGLVIFSNHNIRILKQKLDELQIYRKIAASGENIEALVAKHEGVKKLFVAVKESGHLDYEGNAWLLVTSIDTAIAFAPVRELGRKSLLTGFIALFVVILLAPFMSSTISKPIRILTEVTSDISQDLFDMRVPMQIPPEVLASKDEVGNLSQAFRKMIDDLQKSRDELVGEIIERRRVEEILAANEKLYRTLIESISEVVWLAEPDGRVTFLNKAWQEFTGRENEESLGTGWAASLHPEDRRSVLKKWRYASKHGKPYQGECRFRASDGLYRTVILASTPVFDDLGKIVNWVGIATDITERKQAEEALARHADELVRSNNELQQFAYVASHDLQEPLRMVSSYMQLLERRYKGKLDSNAHEFINYAVDGATRMRRLIKDLLAYSRVGTQRKGLRPTDCEAVLEAVIHNLQVAIEESDAVVTHDALPIVVADDTQLTQLFQNLIGNAIKFRGEKPPIIHISAEKEATEWIFLVRDNGIGIDQEYTDRIFLIFQRLHTREAYSGTGIGLAICKKIVDRHGGSIWIDSEPGEGSSFYFTMPAM